jgi:hypothetical protein
MMDWYSPKTDRKRQERENIESAFTINKVNKGDVFEGIYDANIINRANVYDALNRKGKTDDDVKDDEVKNALNRKSKPSKYQTSNRLAKSKENTIPANEPISIADEIRKLGKLKEEGLITPEEFQQMKQDLIKKNR